MLEIENPALFRGLGHRGLNLVQAKPEWMTVAASDVVRCLLEITQAPMQAREVVNSLPACFLAGRSPCPWTPKRWGHSGKASHRSHSLAAASHLPSVTPMSTGGIVCCDE